MDPTAVRVAICEDSRAYAAGLRRFLETDGDLQVVAVATDAEGLIAELPRTLPELVAMDIELTGIDAIEAIRRIMATRPVPIVVLGEHTGPDGDVVAQALNAGASFAVSKAELRLDQCDAPRAGALRERLAALGRAGAPAVASASRRLPRQGVASVIGIGASAGGPPALAEILGALSADFALPIVVVPHMSPGFAEGLARWLDDIVALPVRLAGDGDASRPGVAIAPEGAHLVRGDEAGRLQLDRRTAAGPHRPSVDVLLESLAQRCGRGAVGIVLSGMGRDGAGGIAAICAADGAAVAERPEHARLSGMPSAATKAGAVPLGLAEIGRVLATLSGRRSP